jgi:hypothetical protein
LILRYSAWAVLGRFLRESGRSFRRPLIGSN